MSLLLPTPAEIRQESRLRPEQLSLKNVAEVDSDIDTRILEQSQYVLTRLSQLARPSAFPFTDAELTTAYPALDSDGRAHVTLRQMTLFKTITRLFTLGSLYSTAGNLQPEYVDKARYFDSRAEAMLKSLEAEVMSISSDNIPGASVSGATTLTTGRGHLTGFDEEEVWIRL